MRVHFIAIGGSAMHNLAIALHQKGYSVTGSDDEIFEPSKSRLASKGLLPKNEGWFPERIHPELDAVILGMHAKADNPELKRANELGIRIFSYPEYLYEQAKDKTRVVIGGSHGKTTITAMILHVLKENGINCDYMVGAQLEGFDVMVKLSEEAEVMIFEGDEYLTSPIDLRPKFHLYRPDIALLSGVAWDHINVFPTFENYVDQFREFIRLISPDGTLIFCDEDKVLHKICREEREDLQRFPYTTPTYRVENGITYLLTNVGTFPLQIFGKHNLLNMNGARLICNQLGVSDLRFYEAITTFMGASKRLELLAKGESYAIYKDFAHAPSKVKATVHAVKEQFPERTIVACLELHTYSSLSEGFLYHYAGVLDEAEIAMVYFDHHAIKLKRLPAITAGQIRTGFNQPSLEVFDDSGKLKDRLSVLPKENVVYLMMSSGNFNGMKLDDLVLL
ncbi:UDP-N-acetylmuramate--L-alanine ligase [Bacteroidota bacterium]